MKEILAFVPYILGILAIALVIFIVSTGYVKASPDVAIVISGIRKEPRVLIGRGGLRVPFIEKIDYLHLGQMSVDIKTDSYIPTNDFINVKVDAVAKVRINTSPEGMLKAERNFLNKAPQEIALDLQDSLQGNMREIIGTLDLKSINTDRDSFSDQVMEKASKDMEKLGIEILSCNIQNVTDENGLINDLGMDNTSKIKKDAAIAKAQAEADRDVAIAKAAADKAANEARVLAETEIARRNNELAIRKAELKLESDKKQAMADASYEIQKQEEQKLIQTATVNAQIAKAERDAELKQKEVEIRQQELAASIEKQADADRYAVTQKAEADLIRLQKEAEAKRYIAEMEAEGIAAKGRAEAEAIRLKGIAEAESMEKKAEAYQKYNGAAMAEMMIRIMPDLAAEIAKPISAIDKVTIYDSGNGESGVSQISGNMPVIMKQVFDTMSEATGVDLREIMKANTYDAKVTKNINVTGLNSADLSAE